MTRAPLPPTRRLLLVRHGQTAWNAEHRWQGSRDIALSETGREQARALGRRLSGVPLAAAFCSGMARSRETALLATGGRLEVADEPLLREISYGTWEGVTDADVATRWPDDHARWRGVPHEIRPGGGESLDELAARAVEGLRRCLRAAPEGTVLVVAHGGVNRVLIARMLDIPLSRFWSLDQSPSNLTLLELPARADASGDADPLAGARLLLANCTRHLDPPHRG